MTLKRFMAAIASLALLGAIIAGNASAAAVTGGEWYVEGTTLAEGTKEAVECENTGNLKLTGVVGGATLFELTAEQVTCLESTIYNEGGSGHDTGRLEFTGVTVMDPPNCEVKEGKVVTEPLETELFMDSENPEIAFDRFKPDAAAGATRFAIVHIVGLECTVAGNKVLKGEIFGEAENPTGVEASIQPLVFGPSVDATAGGGLVFAGNPATLEGTVDNYLLSGKEFGPE